MRYEDRIKLAAAKIGIALGANPVASPDGAGVYHVILDRAAPRAKVKRLERTLAVDGINLKLSFYGEPPDPFRSAIKESVSRTFGNRIEAITVFESGGSYQIIIIPGGDSVGLKADIESHVDEVRRLFDSPPVVLKVELEASKPTAVEFLAIARRKSPVDCQAMQAELGVRGFRSLTFDWINHQFDRLRKGGMLHRQADRTYVLTQAGLFALGSGKGRNSPDVSRLLDLARRRT